MEALEEDLKKTGLAGNEAKVYLCLLKYGDSSANEIAKHIGMDRTLTYTVLNHLVEKGMTTYIHRENKKYFKSTEPSNLLNPVKEKEYFITNLISKLENLKISKEENVEVSIYEGKKAVRSIYNLFSKYKNFVAFGATGKAYDYLYESPAMVKDLVNKGVSGRIITSIKNKNHPMTRISSIQYKFVPYESQSTTSIFRDCILIHIVKEKPLVILIKSKEIATTYKNYFEDLWKKI